MVFQGCASLNGAVGTWNVSTITDMSNLFEEATAFDQNLGDWPISTNNAFYIQMFANSGMSTANYDLTLQGWAAKGVTGVILSGQTGMTYCDGSAARTTLINTLGWTIDGDALACPTVTTWDGSMWDNGTPTASIGAVINGNYDACRLCYHE